MIKKRQKFGLKMGNFLDST